MDLITFFLGSNPPPSRGDNNNSLGSSSELLEKLTVAQQLNNARSPAEPTPGLPSSQRTGVAAASKPRGASQTCEPQAGAFTCRRAFEGRVKANVAHILLLSKSDLRKVSPTTPPAPAPPRVDKGKGRERRSAERENAPAPGEFLPLGNEHRFKLVLEWSIALATSWLSGKLILSLISLSCFRLVVLSSSVKTTSCMLSPWNFLLFPRFSPVDHQ